MGRVMHSTDVLSALIFAIVGSWFVMSSLRMNFGEPMDMGPAFFPRVIGFLLLAFATVIGWQGMRRIIREASGHRISLDIVPILTVVAATVAFCLTLQRFGLIFAAAVLVLISGFAVKGAKPTEVLVCALILSVGSGLLFVYGLGLQAPILPRF